MSYGNLKERDGKLVIEIALDKEDTGGILDYCVYEEVARSQGCVLEDGTGDVWRFVWDAVTLWVGREYDALRAEEWRKAEEEEARMYQRCIDDARAIGDEETARRLEDLRARFDEDYDDEDCDDEDADVDYLAPGFTENQIAEDVEPASRSFW